MTMSYKSFLGISAIWLVPRLGLFGLGMLALLFFKLNELLIRLISDLNLIDGVR